MAINKVIYHGNTLIDLTNGTVAPETLFQGATAHNRAGELIEGTAEFGSGGVYTLQGVWKQTLECYDTIVVHGNISGTVTASETENSFRSITYTGLGEPYIYFYSSEYYQDGSSDATYTAHTIHPISVNFGETEQEVDKSFYNWFTKYFTKVEDSSGDDSGGDSDTTYTLSGTWEHTNGNWDSTVRQDINGSVTCADSPYNNGTFTFTAIECETSGEPWINFYNGTSQVAYTAAHTVYSTQIAFGETEQEVFKEFYDWFTSSFTKVEDTSGYEGM